MSMGSDSTIYSVVEGTENVIEETLEKDPANGSAEGKTYGYVRVSTKDQNTDRQVTAMIEFGIPEKRIFQDKMSGKDFQRPEYQRLVKRVRPGDTIVIKTIDRLGRNYSEILEQWRMITKDKCVYIIVLDMPLLCTRQRKDLTETLITDIVLQLLSYVAQTEREFIHQRQAEGIAAAKARGVTFGRQFKEIPEEYPDMYDLWVSGSISARGAANRLGVDHKTFLRWTARTQMQMETENY